MAFPPTLRPVERLHADDGWSCNRRLTHWLNLTTTGSLKMFTSRDGVYQNTELTNVVYICHDLHQLHIFKQLMVAHALREQPGHILTTSLYPLDNL
ncbi:hypothetical protein T11_4523 [Trichinella zimbabwensis]|uniref:Uncharacterized protein n=1 Tax=Trichinella zimbabwensis TaxID=268475 RepID=A0A0V1HP20_9BILA|nr:hypothetical protein T11_4523 [Trichinella zimbabwensis]